jgi:hypothetical protein
MPSCHLYLHKALHQDILPIATLIMMGTMGIPQQFYHAQFLITQGYIGGVSCTFAVLWKGTHRV